MAEKKKTSKRTRSKKSETSKVQVVVEVDGNPVGLLDLDWDRLWPAINHRNRDPVNIEWMKRAEFDAVANATVLRRFMRRLEGRLYQGLGDEVVRAELDIENLYSKMDAAAQEFGRTDTELQQVLAGGGGTCAAAPPLVSGINSPNYRPHDRTGRPRLPASRPVC